jgi:hypothetical protein
MLWHCSGILEHGIVGKINIHSFIHSFISYARSPNQATQPLDMEQVKT